jgi:tetratricopeptide (TPR) repeat protein
MKGHRTVTAVAALLLVTLFTGSVLSMREVQALRGPQATLEEVLYMPSGKTLKRMSLGYSTLLADIYWTRAVQYFGGKQLQRATRFDLLYPLLDITTDLDPKLIGAYQSGSIFLSQKVPEGAGQPDKAVALLEKGIRANPEYWRLYFTLGFVHYQDRRDYTRAEEAFKKGSEVPGALPFMKIMAARMAEHAQDIDTALALWKGVYEMTPDKLVRDTATKHILSLLADAAMEELERRVQSYRERTGVLPSAWSDLIRAGMLRGIPVDPTDEPYELMADGTVQVRKPSQFPFLGEARGKGRQ